MSESKNAEVQNLVIAAAYDDCLARPQLKLESKGIVVTSKTITIVIKIAMEIVEASALKGEEQKILVEKQKHVVDRFCAICCQFSAYKKFHPYTFIWFVSLYIKFFSTVNINLFQLRYKYNKL